MKLCCHGDFNGKWIDWILIPTNEKGLYIQKYRKIKLKLSKHLYSWTSWSFSSVSGREGHQWDGGIEVFHTHPLHRNTDFDNPWIRLSLGETLLSSVERSSLYPFGAKKKIQEQILWRGQEELFTSSRLQGTGVQCQEKRQTTKSHRGKSEHSVWSPLPCWTLHKKPTIFSPDYFLTWCHEFFS